MGFSSQATHLVHGFRKWDFLLHSRGDQSLGQTCAVLDDIRRRRLARAEIRESPRNRARQHGKHPGFVARQIVAFRSRGNKFVDLKMGVPFARSIIGVAWIASLRRTARLRHRESMEKVACRACGHVFIDRSSSHFATCRHCGRPSERDPRANV
jgi:hypothetical protein